MKLLASKGGCAEGYWLRAEKQSGGVGRLGRRWTSPVGNLYCSTLVDIRPGDPPPTTLSFVASLAVYAAVRSYLPSTEMVLKWPNDILVSQAKICGILLERVQDQVVVGIGINVAVTPTVEGRAVTSLSAEGSDVDAARLLESLTETFSEQIALWRAKGIRHILAAWQSLAHPVGSPITTSDETGEKISGEFAGLRADGALCLRKADGTLIELHAGDISIG